MQTQPVTDIVEAQGVGELGVDQAHDMAPGAEGAGLVGDAGVARQLGDQVRRNQIAELAQEREAAARWLAGCLFIHPRPCGRVQPRRPTLFSSHNTITSGGHLCNEFARRPDVTLSVNVRKMTMSELAECFVNGGELLWH